MSAPAEAVEAVRKARSVLIATHSPMDGDGLGCGLALLRTLRAAGKEVRFVTEAPVPRSYAFLPGFAEIERLADGPVPACDLLLGVDAAEAARLGRAYAERPAGARVLNIDHHVSNGGFGDIVWTDPEAAATGEQVYELLRALGLPVDAEAALCLFVSLVTDTGRFCYSSTTARTLRIASELVAAGADPDQLQRHLYGAVPMGVLRLHARATEDLRLHADGRVAVLAVPHGYGEDIGAQREEDVKDLVDLVVSVAGVLVGALVRGLPDGTSKVSLRSKDDRANVAEMARRWGGGGHRRAAGFTVAGPPEEVRDRILDELRALAVAASG